MLMGPYKQEAHHALGPHGKAPGLLGWRSKQGM